MLAETQAGGCGVIRMVVVKSVPALVERVAYASANLTTAFLWTKTKGPENMHVLTNGYNV